VDDVGAVPMVVVGLVVGVVGGMGGMGGMGGIPVAPDAAPPNKFFHEGTVDCADDPARCIALEKMLLMAIFYSDHFVLFFRL
jgi:hypothetical protein